MICGPAPVYEPLVCDPIYSLWSTLHICLLLQMPPTPPNYSTCCSAQTTTTYLAPCCRPHPHLSFSIHPVISWEPPLCPEPTPTAHWPYGSGLSVHLLGKWWIEKEYSGKWEQLIGNAGDKMTTYGGPCGLRPDKGRPWGLGPVGVRFWSVAR